MLPNPILGNHLNPFIHSRQNNIPGHQTKPLITNTFDRVFRGPPL
jgi:hypothetical protein